MTPSERIVYRLRIYIPHTDAPTQIIYDAADHITQLAAELAAVTADRDRLQQLVGPELKEAA